MKSIDNETIIKIQTAARKARGSILTMTTLSNSGHPGGSMSCIDILMALYHRMNHNPRDPNLADRDRVIVSNGHISPAVFSTLGMMGYFDLNDAISQFRKLGSIYEGHIERDVPGVEWTTGNLGQGLSAGCGMALASKIKNVPYNTFVLMGDGEQQKGQITEARRFAIKYQLNKLVAIIDYNQLQISGNIADVMPQNIKLNWESDGWKVIEINGHDIAEISKALDVALASDIPTMIMAHTVMGKGVDFMENLAKYHGSTLSEEQLANALKQLDLPYELEKYKKLRNEFSIKSAKTIHRDFSLHANLIQGKPLVYDTETDNRSAWGTAIAELAKLNLDNPTPIVVVDCDLASSVKTADFAKVSPDRFIQTGIMEHHAAVMSGALSACGIQTFWADFGMFGVAEVYNMQRLNDINHLNLKTIVTHVGIDVGEDGRTHQSIDYIGLTRNLFGYHIICPADPNQTDRVIRWLANQPGNYIVAMGRSKLPIIRDEHAKPYFGLEYCYEYGKGDVIREGNDGTIFVTGTPIGRAIKAVDNLRQEGIYLRLVYISSPLSITDECIEIAANNGIIHTVEDHNINSGLGSIVADKLVQLELHCKLVKHGVKEYPLSGASDDVYEWAGLDVKTLTKSFREISQKK
ncbi:MAG: transketolase [Candidatus Cloacimonetes bacterium HGW-Cloacimonetes-1]|nr:MAG: transketolase [Candidatus Cloacimonetes bacterium HGW-Cloacimonetes-1]